MSSPTPTDPYGRGHRALEIASIAFVFGSLLWIACRITIVAWDIPRALFGIGRPP